MAGWSARLMPLLVIAAVFGGVPVTCRRFGEPAGLSLHRKAADWLKQMLPGSRDSDGKEAQQPEFPLQRSDLLVVLPSSLSRLDLVYSSRAYRQGVPTFIVTDKLPFKEQEFAWLGSERWGITYRQPTDSYERRAAIAPFLANNTVGYDSYKWILYGDDDTVFVIDNIIKVLSTLDFSQPYLISDALWWPENGKSDRKKIHANRDAPRCLPCNYTDLLLVDGTCPAQHGFIAPEGCPCTPETLVSQGMWSGGDQVVFDRNNKKFLRQGGPTPGWWYMIHGGAGALISQGAMRQASFEAVEDYLVNRMPVRSSDAMLTEVMWEVLRVAPTDPGYGYCRPHIQMFDPGWSGEQRRFGDLGGDPRGVIERLTAALEHDSCGAECHEQLQHTLTIHVRARSAGSDKTTANSTRLHPWHTACNEIEQLGVLFDQYQQGYSNHNRAEGDIEGVLEQSDCGC
ncbi:hypothetical protein WJX73_005489 [Symbiochloris irregularis]|uniref:Hexosyltransferase n=1 Tax=Symbiochloris irregularis TaxID=706552 RepID=A0AAW1NYT6_9CHLO